MHVLYVIVTIIIIILYAYSRIHQRINSPGEFSGESDPESGDFFLFFFFGHILRIQYREGGGDEEKRRRSPLCAKRRRSPLCASPEKCPLCVEEETHTKRTLLKKKTREQNYIILEEDPSHARQVSS
jgi:hypothetical protein